MHPEFDISQLLGAEDEGKKKRFGANDGLVSSFFKKQILCVAKQLRGGRLHTSLKLHFHTGVHTCLLYDVMYSHMTLYMPPQCLISRSAVV